MGLAENIPVAPLQFDSAEAFLAWAWAQPERCELFDGIVRMMAGGSANHSRLSRNALSALVARLRTGPCEAFGPDLAVILGPRHVFFPDVTVSCEPVREEGVDHPVVVFEVLSPSTAAYDMGDKAAAYRTLPSLRHLVLVSQDRIRVQHFHREADGRDFTLTELASVDAILGPDGHRRRDDRGRALRPGGLRRLSGRRHGVSPSGSGRPWMRQQATSVLASRQAIVIGPTPPGTGVIAPATCAAAGEVDVADECLPPRDAVDADVDHGRARLHPVAGDQPRPADRGHQDVGPRQTAGRSRVREWAMVTVQLSRSSSCAIGLPTMFERPSTTASQPGEVAAAGRAAASGSRAACRAPIAGSPDREPAGVDRVEAVDVLGRIDRLDARGALSICGGSGSCTRMPWTRGIGVEPRDQRQHLGLGRRRRQPVLLGVHAGLDASAGPCCGRRPALAGSSPTSTTASPGTTPVPRVQLRRPRRTRARRPAAKALPSMISAAMRPSASNRRPLSASPGGRNRPASRRPGRRCPRRGPARRREAGAVHLSHRRLSPVPRCS